MIKGVILDLDGTVYLGKQEVPGAARFILFLKESGIRYLFVTNRANRTPTIVAEHLCTYGIPCTENDVLTSAQATVQYLKRGSVYYIGEEGLKVELDKAGMTVNEEAPDYVIVSFDRTFNYDKLRKACRLIHAGAQFIATNPDKALKTATGLTPGTGSIVAAVAAGSGKEPVMIGKPERLIMDMALERLGLQREEVINVGDNLATDIPAGIVAGIRTAFILTGVSSREDLAHTDLEPAWIVASYEELTTIVRKENGL
jgi:4-nitrophenyl phosphatase